MKRSTGATAANGQPVYRVLTISTAGVVRDYGIPYPNGSAFQVIAGPKGLLTSPAVYSGEGDDSPIGDGRVRYSLYARYGSWKTVYNARADIDFSCGRPSASHAGCAFEEAVGGRHDGYALLSLQSGKLAWLVDHPKQCWFSAQEAFNSALVGEASSTSPKQHCVRGRLTALAADGRIENSKHRWGVHSLSTVGPGRILVSKNDQRAIYGLTSVNAKPKLLVQAHRGQRASRASARTIASWSPVPDSDDRSRPSHLDVTGAMLTAGTRSGSPSPSWKEDRCITPLPPPDRRPHPRHLPAPEGFSEACW